MGLNQSITISFMLVGHTKFAPDWCFGLLKQRYRRTYVSSLQDIVDVVNVSADVNVAQVNNAHHILEACCYTMVLLSTARWHSGGRDCCSHVPVDRVPSESLQEGSRTEVATPLDVLCGHAWSSDDEGI